MAIDLTWKGRAWPRATITGHSNVIRIDERSGRPQTIAANAVDVAVTGAGRKHDLSGPAAFWRNFATMSPSDDRKVLDFLRRHGDPFGELSPETPINAGGWAALTVRLLPIATLWDQPGADCVSHITIDDDRRGKISTDIMNSPQFQRGIKWEMKIDEIGSLKSHMAAQSLAAFMLASSLIHLQLRQPMSVCEQCGDWFAVQRQGTRFCTPSCRAAYSTKIKGDKTDG
jgi:hypothetical protein